MKLFLEMRQYQEKATNDDNVFIAFFLLMKIWLFPK